MGSEKNDASSNDEFYEVNLNGKKTAAEKTEHKPSNQNSYSDTSTDSIRQAVTIEEILKQAGEELDLTNKEIQFAENIINKTAVAGVFTFGIQAAIAVYLVGISAKLLQSAMGDETLGENYEYMEQISFHLVNFITSVVANTAFMSGEIVLNLIKNAWLKHKEQQAEGDELNWNAIKDELKKHGIEETSLKDPAVRAHLTKFFLFGTFFFTLFGYMAQLTPDMNNSMAQIYSKLTDYSEITLTCMKALNSALLGIFYNLGGKALKLNLPATLPWQVFGLLFGMQIAPEVAAKLLPNLQNPTAQTAVESAIPAVMGSTTATIIKGTTEAVCAIYKYCGSFFVKENVADYQTQNEYKREETDGYVTDNETSPLLREPSKTSCTIV